MKNVSTIALVGNSASSFLNFRKELIQEFAKKGWKVIALAPDFTSDSRARLREWGAEPIRIVMPRSGFNPIRIIQSLLSLWRVAKVERVSTMFAFFSLPVVVSSIAFKLAGTSRRVGMIEGLGSSFTQETNERTPMWKQIQGEFVAFLFKITFPLLDQVVFLNNDDPRHLERYYGVRCTGYHVLGGIGVDLKYFQYSIPKTNPLCFVFVGRLLKEKGIHYFIEVANSIKLKWPNVDFLVAGSLDPGNPSSLTQNELELAIAHGNITYLGQVDDIRSVLERSSVLVLPTYYREGVPRSIQEAMAIGRAIITTDTPGCRDTVVSGSNGFLVPPRELEPLVAAVLNFIEDPSLALTMGLESRRFAELKYDITRITPILFKRIVGDSLQ